MIIIYEPQAIVSLNEYLGLKLNKHIISYITICQQQSYFRITIFTVYQELERNFITG